MAAGSAGIFFYISALYSALLLHMIGGIVVCSIESGNPG